MASSVRYIRFTETSFCKTRKFKTIGSLIKSFQWAGGNSKLTTVITPPWANMDGATNI